jgi:hypothetical protein
VLLLYPNYAETPQAADSFTIKSGFDGLTHDIRITAAEIPFWSMADFQRLHLALQERLGRLLEDALG